MDVILIAALKRVIPAMEEIMLTQLQQTLVQKYVEMVTNQAPILVMMVILQMVMVATQIVKLNMAGNVDMEEE